MVTSVPRDMATPTSAWVSAGASFTPSPATRTRRPRGLQRRHPLPLLDRTHLGDRRLPMPSAAATASVVRRLSPERRLDAKAERRELADGLRASGRTASATTSRATSRPPRDQEGHRVAPLLAAAGSRSASAGIRRAPSSATKSRLPTRTGSPCDPRLHAAAGHGRGSPSPPAAGSPGDTARRLHDGPPQAVLGAPLHRGRQPQRIVGPGRRRGAAAPPGARAVRA